MGTGRTNRRLTRPEAWLVWALTPIARWVWDRSSGVHSTSALTDEEFATLSREFGKVAGDGTITEIPSTSLMDRDPLRRLTGGVPRDEGNPQEKRKGLRRGRDKGHWYWHKGLLSWWGGRADDF
jgi:hypothetical protein